jgi:hypothetical protein
VPSLSAAAREIVVVMSSGGRPEGAPPADVTVRLNDRVLGTARVSDGFRPYTFTVPPDIADEAARADEPARLGLVTATWNPQHVLGSPDDRDLGVMVDRVQVR